MRYLRVPQFENHRPNISNYYSIHDISTLDIKSKIPTKAKIQKQIYSKKDIEIYTTKKSKFFK